MHLLGLVEEGLELGSDNGDSLAISDGPKESLGVGACLGLELGLMLDHGVELGMVDRLVLGTVDRFNDYALGTDATMRRSRSLLGTSM